MARRAEPGRGRGAATPELRLVRPADLPGAGIMSIHASQRAWKCLQQTWDLCVVTEGEGRWRYRGGELDSHAGHVRFKEPGEMFRTLDVHSPMSLCVLQLDPEVLPGMLDRPRVHLRVRQVAFDRRRAERLVARIRALEGTASRLVRETSLSAIVEEFLAPNLETSVVRRSGRAPRAMRRVRDYLHTHYREEIRLRTLADLAGVHEVYLVRCFRQTYGLPPHEFQTELRVDAARRALLRGASCAEAAALVGFYDQSHLTRHFKRTVGIPPGRFRGQSEPGSGPEVHNVQARSEPASQGRIRHDRSPGLPGTV